MVVRPGLYTLEQGNGKIDQQQVSWGAGVDSNARDTRPSCRNMQVLDQLRFRELPWAKAHPADPLITDSSEPCVPCAG